MNESVLGVQGENGEARCNKCSKLIAKKAATGCFEFKCSRCNAFGLLSEQVVITDPEGRVLYLNESAERTTGYTKEESIGKKISSLWGGHMSDEFYKHLWEAISDGKTEVKVTMNNRNKSGEFYTATVHISGVPDAQGKTNFFIAIESVVK